MTDRTGATVALIALAGGLVVLLVVMVGIETPDGVGRAVATIGLILAEVIVLYAGYEALTRIARPAAVNESGVTEP